MAGEKEKVTSVPLPSINPEEGRCNFYLSGKKARFCRSLVVSGRRFCGNHLHVCGSATLPAALRVPCPLDPNHDILATELEIHITKRCPALLLAQKERAQPHFLEDINVGSDCEPDLPPLPPPAPATAAPLSSPADPALEPLPAPAAATSASAPSAAASGPSTPSPPATYAHPPAFQPPKDRSNGGAGSPGSGAARVPAVGPFVRGRAAQRAALARSLGAEGFAALLSRVEAAHAAVCGSAAPPPLRVLRPPECEDVLAAPSQQRPFDLKHGLQQASIVGNMQHAGLLNPGPKGGSHVAVVEFGAGKGYLGGTLAECCGVGRLVATDIKAGLRLKADRHLRHIVFGRHRVDLKDYVPAATPELSAAPAGTPWLAVAKHLCGAATDYGLRACMLPYGAAKPPADGTVAAATAASATPSVSGAGEGSGSGEGRETAAAPAAAAPQLQAVQGRERRRSSSSADGDGGSSGRGAVEKRPRTENQVNAGPEMPPSCRVREGDVGHADLSSGAAHFSDGAAAGQPAGLPRAAAPAGPVLRGLAIAPCCHHRCGWRAYVGKPLFRRLGLTAEDFEMVSWMTGWALCGHDTPAGQVGTGEEDEEDDEARAGGETDPRVCDGSDTNESTRDVRIGSTDATTNVTDSAILDGTRDGVEKATPKDSQRDGTSSVPAMEDEVYGGPVCHTDDKGGCGGAGGARDARVPPPGVDPASRLSRAAKMAIGNQCKQLIEAGRLDWLRRRFRSAELVFYIGPEVTGENRLLLAVQPVPQGGGVGVGGDAAAGGLEGGADGRSRGGCGGEE